ncbi:hypothetical protein ZEAMMB73_Zm00001d014106 [Zea mays]|uniref:Uncharacterized protein n=1 Tax=Zea mays TaxID=4577 RepID=A0A1D6GPX6_MAIZE|nr:hypothetical protein ZEAMMB73_Zm00001d014106 [Zea mays]
MECFSDLDVNVHLVEVYAGLLRPELIYVNIFKLRNGGSDYFGKGVLKSEGIILALFAMHSYSP